MKEFLITSFAALPLITAGIVASLLAGAAAGIGALPIFFLRRISHRMQDSLLGFSAGVMLAAVSFSLLLPALEESGNDIIAVGGGLLLGALALWGANRLVPHDDLLDPDDRPKRPPSFHRLWLFVVAITLHNFPEGLAVGVGFGSGNVGNGVALTTGIFLQNLPEGFAVALAFLAMGTPRWKAVLLALATGVVETIGGFIGAGTVSLTAAILPWALAFAGGAMLFVISHDIIPETHHNGHETPATFSLMVGFALMMALDVALA